MNIENLMLNEGAPIDANGDGQLLRDLQSELAQASATSAVGALAASLAHELNQPLTAITNYVQTARDLLENEAGDHALLREALAEAATQSLRASLVVRRLREFITRAGTQKAIWSLKALIADTNALAPISTELADINVRVTLDPGADAIFADRSQLQQVLLNLIRNAVAALKDAPIKRLEIASRAIANSQVEIIIADSGHGLSPQTAATLFEPFRTTSDAGMGLGLSICRTIIEDHGGRIWSAASALGGASFHFTLSKASPPA